MPYEFLNIGGKKMSTSKGRGAAAHEIAEVVPPEQLRFLFLRPRPNQAIDFDPDGTDAIPRLFDEFDQFALATTGAEVKGELPPGSEAMFALCRCSIPNADVAARGRALPAGLRAPRLARPDARASTSRPASRRRRASPLTEREQAILAERVAAARAWLETYAPERSAVAGPRGRAAREAADLDDAQRAYLPLVWPKPS